MHKTSTTLADGRECIFYDRRPVRRAVRSDPRHLPDRPSAGGLRYDVRTGDWIVVAAHRQDRSVRPDVVNCPLCPTRGEVATEVPAPDYEVVVFENRSPALTTVGIQPAEPGALPGDVDTSAVRRSAPAYGRCEIICFSSDHDASFADLKPDQARLVFEAWADRSAVLQGMPGIAQVFCFENRGADIGATQPHPHGQIYAFGYVTARTARMLRQAEAYRIATGGNLFDDALEIDRADAGRVVLADEFWTAFVPYAARWPYEVHVYPNRRHRDMTDLDGAELESLAVIYLDLLQRYDRLFDLPAPYVAAWHQAPVGPAGDDFAMHLELFTNRRSATRLKHLAGTEIGMDAFSNDIEPEWAAARLRELSV